MNISRRELEHELRQTARDAVSTPPGRLRYRVLHQLLETPRAPAARTHRRDYRLAMASCAMFLALIAICAALLPNDRLIENAAVHGPPSRPMSIDLPSLPRVRVEQVEHAIAQPLKQEMRLIARDLERTVERFRDSLPRLTLNVPSESPAIDDAAEPVTR